MRITWRTMTTCSDSTTGGLKKLIEVFVWIICLLLKKKTACLTIFLEMQSRVHWLGVAAPWLDQGVALWGEIFLSFFLPFLLGIPFSPNLSLLSYLKLLRVNIQLFVGSSGEEQQAGWLHLCSSGPCSHLHKVQANGESSVTEHKTVLLLLKHHFVL